MRPLASRLSELETALVNAVTRKDARRGGGVRGGDGVRGDADPGDDARRGEEVVAWVR